VGKVLQYFFQVIIAIVLQYRLLSGKSA